MLNDLPVETLHQLLTYDEFSGALIWKHRDRSFFSSDQGYNSWNARFPGRQVGSISNGYIVFSLFKRLYKGHRVAFALYHGAWPDGHIDHIDGDRSNNRIANLRAVTQRENNINKAQKRDNTSGCTGVGKTKEGNRWRARIQLDSKSKTLGSFVTLEEAIAARKKAEVEYGFHPNHGRKEGFGK